MGRNVAGRNVIGEKNLWGETSWNQLTVFLLQEVYTKIRELGEMSEWEKCHMG